MNLSPVLPFTEAPQVGGAGLVPGAHHADRPARPPGACGHGARGRLLPSPGRGGDTSGRWWCCRLRCCSCPAGGSRSFPPGSEPKTMPVLAATEVTPALAGFRARFRVGACALGGRARSQTGAVPGRTAPIGPCAAMRRSRPGWSCRPRASRRCARRSGSRGSRWCSRPLFTGTGLVLLGIVAGMTTRRSAGPSRRAGPSTLRPWGRSCGRGSGWVCARRWR